MNIILLHPAEMLFYNQFMTSYPPVGRDLTLTQFTEIIYGILRDVEDHCDLI